MKDLFSPSHHHHHQHHHHSCAATTTAGGGGCSDGDISMDDNDGHSVNTSQSVNNHTNISINTSNEFMSITSPPRTIMRTAVRRSLSAAGTGATCTNIRSGGFRSRLFEDDEEDQDNLQLPPPVLDRKPSAIKPLSLHLDFAVEAGDMSHLDRQAAGNSHGPLRNPQLDLHTSTSATTASTAPNKTPRRLTGAMRKRQAEQYELYTKQCLSFDDGGEEDVFSATESPVDMYSSPRISPGSPPSSGSLSSNTQSRIAVYRSPSIHRPQRCLSGSSASIPSHKSPSSFLTLDGRTVQSNNPFSPMIFEEHLTPGSMMDTSTHVSSARAKMELRSSPTSPSNGNHSLFLNMNDTSLSLPASLNSRHDASRSSGQSGEGGRMLRPRHTLHNQRNCNPASESAILSMGGLAPIHLTLQQQQHSVQRQEEQKQKESYYTRDGYPERTGRYSFTGSPIKEHLEIPPSNSGKHHATSNEYLPDVCTNINKIRRRTKGDDVVAAAAYGELAWKRRGMYVQTSQENNFLLSEANKLNPDDTISPTDVVNFPLFRPSSSNTKTLPPTPSKPVRRPPCKKYTPIRKPTGPPPTPMPSIRRARSFDDDDFDDVPDRGGARRHSSGSAMDYLSLSPGGEGGQFLAAAAAPTAPASRFYSDFDVISELGNGSFGNVYKVLSRLDGCMYAIKVAHRPAKGIADRDRMLKEVYALASLSDQADTATFHIVRYHQAWMEDHRLYIQTELCTTTLQAEMQQASPMALPLWRRYKCLREILLALDFIHKNDMVHLDIKPENVFVSVNWRCCIQSCFES
jgi:hypothetical protein